MLWFVLASILLIEVCIVIVLLQIISLSPRAWLRWLIWLLAIIVSLAVFAAILSLIHSTLIHNKGNWPRGQNEFSIRAPFQTFRLLLILSAAGIPAFLLVFGIVGLLRVKDGTFRLLSFGVSWRSSVIALLIAVALMMASLLCNDRLVRQKIAALDDESRRLAMTVQPEDCDDLKNGAEFLRSLKASPNSLSRKGLPDPREDIELLRRHDWQDYFSRNRDIAQQAREASSHPCWRLDADWLQPDVLGDFPDEHILFDCINLLHFQGRQDLLAGNVEPALANAIALRRIAERLLYDPRVVAHVAATSAEKSAFSLIEHLLFLYRPSPDDVAKLVQPEFKFRNSLENYCVRQQGAHYHALAQRYFGLLASSEENKIGSSG